VEAVKVCPELKELTRDMMLLGVEKSRHYPFNPKD
jgi:hypothetical protein